MIGFSITYTNAAMLKVIKSLSILNLTHLTDFEIDSVDVKKMIVNICVVGYNSLKELQDFINNFSRDDYQGKVREILAAELL